MKVQMQKFSLFELIKLEVFSLWAFETTYICVQRLDPPELDTVQNKSCSINTGEIV